jgi:hypothetical protein
MNKTLQILKAIGIVIAISIVFSISVSQSQPIRGTDEETIIDYFESIRLNPTEDYIYELESFISENRSKAYASYVRERGIKRPEPYVRYLMKRATSRSLSYAPYLRENAIFVLTDISIQKNQSQEIVGFLKNISMNEQDDSIRTAADSNLDLIRDVSPLEVGSLDIAVTGEIKKGENITISGKISSDVPVTAAVIGINRLHKDIESLSNPVIKLNIAENGSILTDQQVEFRLRLKEEGRYNIPISLLLSMDRIDYNSIYKNVYLNVSATNQTSYDSVYIEG